MSRIQPPKLAQKVLRVFLRDDLSEEVLGDLEEHFYITLKMKSVFRTKLNYWFEVLHYLRPFAIKRNHPYDSNNYAMFQNYFTIGWRNLTKYKMYSTIKIFGFAVGIAACFLITLFILDELRFDKHIPEANRIFRVVEIWDEPGNLERSTWFQAPFAAALKADYPEIEKAGRYNSSELFGAGANEFRRADQQENRYEEGFVYADQEFLEILGVRFVHGNPAHSLDQPNTMVITKRKADKYFPGEDPVGKLVVLNSNDKVTFKIGGVIEDLPRTSHIQFDFFITLKEKEFWPGEQNFWGATNYPTYIKLRADADPRELEKKLTSVVAKYLLPWWIQSNRSNAKERATYVTYQLQPVQDIYLRSAEVSDSLRHGDIRFVWLFGLVAGFILLIACINFINLSTAKSANRAKEVGLRKVVGSARGNIIKQFLIESLLFSFASFLLGIFIAGISLPYFNTLSGKELTFPWNELWLVPALLGSAITVGIVAGIYPSFYLSAFKPIQVLKGNLSRGSKSSVTRNGLVIFQFSISIILIIGTYVIYQQVEFMLNKKLGYSKEQVLLIQGTHTLGDNIKTFKSELLNISQVKSATISDYLPIEGTKRNGNGFWNEGKQAVERSVSMQRWVVDSDYIKTLGMKLVQGRDFSENMAGDSASIIINQKFARELGLTDPIGKRITNGTLYTIIGVMEDFHLESLRDEIQPVGFVAGISPRIVSVKVGTSDMQGVIESVTKVWKKFSPHQAIRYSFLDERYAAMYADVKRMGNIFVTFAVLAVVVACLGLFALSSFMVEQRSKEISIRLVLGASLKSIFNLLTTNFVKLVLISIAVASPIAWLLMDKWLEDFTYRTEMGWQAFVIPGAMAIVIALLTVSYQSLRAALAKPVDKLRSE
jgi:putative ABC transport system permease protein